jgi:PAS domain S-box-containing protein
MLDPIRSPGRDGRGAMPNPSPVEEGRASTPRAAANAREIVRAALLFMVLLATAVAATSWDRLREFSRGLEFIPFLLFAVICFFVVQLYRRLGHVTELRSAMEAMEGRQTELYSQLEAQKLLQTISASRESFRELVDSFEAAVFTLSLDGKIRATNKAFTGIVQKSFQEVIGASLLDFITEPTAEQLQSGLEKFLARRHWSGLVTVCLAGSGQRRHFDCAVHPVLQGDTPLAVTVIANDVTAEREREAVFATLFETLHEPVWVATCEGRLLDLNSAMAALAGTGDRAALISSSLFDLVLEPERQKLAETMRRRETIRDLEVNVARSDGARAVCIANATPLVDAAGAARYHGTFTDITNRRAMERSLAAEQTFRQQLVASFPDAIVTLDTAGRFTFVSGRAERMFGRSAASLLGAPAGDCFDPQECAAIDTLLRECGKEPSAACRRELHLQGDAGWRAIQAHGTALRNADGDVIGVVLSLRDVTEQRLMEQQLILSERMAAIGQMIEGFAHELNNPLTTILGACELMKAEGIPTAQQRSFELLQAQTARAREIAQNLQLFAGPSTDNRVPLNVGELIQRTVMMRRHALRMSNINLDLAVAEPVATAFGNSAQLMQVFLNLLINAEQACVAAGKPERAIRIRVQTDDETVRCTFQDDGPGISPEIAARIFEPFFSTKRPQRGTGLGLSICRSIVEAHGGRIEYLPAPDGGSAFRVTLPTAAAASRRSKDQSHARVV